MRRRHLGLGRGLGVGVLLAIFASAPAAAVTPEEFYLSSSVRSLLVEIQQHWSEWLAAYELDDVENGEAALERLLETTDQLSMSALPELSLGASTRAAESARLGDFRRARRALDAADRLDPSRPETSFARAAIHRMQGEWWGFVTEMARGYGRALLIPSERRLWTHNAALWLLTTLLVAGCAYAAALMVVRGPALLGSLLEVLRRWVPVPVAIGAILVLLLWPIVISAGIIAVALNWSILLWAYCQRSERWVLALLVLLFGLAPIALDEQRRRIAVEFAPMAQAAEDAKYGRLRGSSFNNLQRLAVVLPESAAVEHLIADQHRRVGQCDEATELYERVVEKEPDNAAARVDLGSCYFLRGEYDQAIESFQRAISIDGDLAEAHFNLALAYSELYRFADSGASLARAQRIDSSRVSRWLDQSPNRVGAEVAGGLRRVREIRRELRASWVLEDDSAAWSSPLRDYLSLPLAFVGIVVATLAGRLLPRVHLEAEAPPLVDWGSRWGSFYRILAPGLSEIEAGESVRGIAALVAISGLLLIPWVDANGYRLPWGFEPVLHLGWWVTLIGLTAFIALRWRRETAL